MSYLYVKWNNFALWPARRRFPTLERAARLRGVLVGGTR